MKGYSTFPKAPALIESHHHIRDTSWGSLTLLQRCSRYILLPKSTGLRFMCVCTCVCVCVIFLLLFVYICFALDFVIVIMCCMPLSVQKHNYLWKPCTINSLPYTVTKGGTHDVMFIIAGNGHGIPSSNPWQSSLHFTKNQYSKGNYSSNYTLSNYGLLVGQNGLFDFGMATGLGERKLWIKLVKRCLKIEFVSHAGEGLDLFIHKIK